MECILFRSVKTAQVPTIVKFYMDITSILEVILLRAIFILSEKNFDNNRKYNVLAALTQDVIKLDIDYVQISPEMNQYEGISY